MTKGQETRQEIVRKAAALFNQKGYEGTALSDLMDATGLKKGGIYRHFESKEELAAEAFDYAWQTAREMRLPPIDTKANAVDQLKQAVGNFVERREGLVPGGCPVLNTAIEADDGNPVLRARVKKALEQWISRLRDVTEEGIRKKEIRKDVEPEKLANLIVGSMEGALMIARLERTNEPLRWAREHLDNYLETLRGTSQAAGPRR